MRLPKSGYCILCRQEIVTTGATILRTGDEDDGEPTSVISVDGERHNLVFCPRLVTFYKEKARRQDKARKARNLKTSRRRTKEA